MKATLLCEEALLVEEVPYDRDEFGSFIHRVWMSPDPEYRKEWMRWAHQRDLAFKSFRRRLQAGGLTIDVLVGIAFGKVEPDAD